VIPRHPGHHTHQSVALPPLFIVLEGLDGSGKTTAGQNVAAALEEQYGCQVLLSCEPHPPSCGGDYIRQVLSKQITSFRLRTLALAFAANRLDHCDRTILPWLEKGPGHVVISDRYYLSSMVYQRADDFSIRDVMRLNELALKPDLFFFLNVSNEVCYERIRQRNLPRELFESNLEEQRQKYREAIDFLRTERGENIVEVDGSKTPDEVSAQILSHLSALAS
jgi:dTMP kinase